ncbi:MAG: hypothetical protein ACE37F_14185 [Nannocystaceae bacterium]|nr:hypothetical protein [bacterium]
MPSPGQTFRALFVPRLDGVPVELEAGARAEVVHANSDPSFEVLDNSDAAGGLDGDVTVEAAAAPHHEVLVSWDVPASFSPNDLLFFRLSGTYQSGGASVPFTATSCTTLSQDAEVLIELRNILPGSCCGDGGGGS